MTRIVFSKAAIEDRREITAYTAARFGVEQVRRLREHFEATMDRIAAFPQSGSLRPELDPEGRSYRYVVVSKVFVLVYELEETELRVIRILHGARQIVGDLRLDDV